uniref:Gelsolin-like domain-containing protein n=1 Tax=Fagus sylvatica TaxID=28930 RepID=A0A2N9IA96_FAGSY
MSSFGSATPRNEERRGKVAALLKQQGVGVKDMTKSVPVNKEVPPLFDRGGEMKVWRIDGSAQTLLPKEDFGKSYSGDCYIVRYTYPAGDREKGYFECCWFGKDSIEGRIFQGEEPPQFVKLFQPMVVLKGGLSSGYKKFITDKGLTDETYKLQADSVALIQISGTSIHNNKAVQVDAAARSLNSMDCFFLQSGSSIFTWHGKQCTFEQQHLAAKVAEFLKELLCNMLMKEKRANPSGVPLEAFNKNTNELFIWNMLIRRCWNISVSELPVKKLGDYSVCFYFGHDLTGDHKVLMEDLLSETFELKL